MTKIGTISVTDLVTKQH